MSSALPTSKPWSEEVVKFAREQNVEQYLQPLWDALHELFPTAKSIRVYFDQDPELRDVKTIMFEAIVSTTDEPDYLAARRRCYDRFVAICPITLLHNFGLHLRRVPNGPA